MKASVSFSYFLLPSQYTCSPSVAEGAPALTFILLKFDNLNPRLIYAFCIKKSSIFIRKKCIASDDWGSQCPRSTISETGSSGRYTRPSDLGTNSNSHVGCLTETNLLTNLSLSFNPYFEVMEMIYYHLPWDTALAGFSQLPISPIPSELPLIDPSELALLGSLLQALICLLLSSTSFQHWVFFF